MSETMTFKVHFARRSHGQVELREGGAPPVEPWREVPTRAARLLATAHRIEGLVRNGELRDYAEVALLAGLTRARICQIVNMLLLAPDVQEQVLFMNRPEQGRELIGEQHLRPIALEPDWNVQRKKFAALIALRSTLARR